ncbi:MAG TPA: riboflavin synthase [Chitinophagales bacterium]|nr:riboflavin synthase [Chitinophagales bacterium]HMU68943.1 riboflavin synthase [Chitinophagales bacterium]HMX04519.1 riboflavin synthase [Chitinophagales bacterium]HMZ88390.1 riboflavin synthase [Chitinophagales bacterium]HNE45876.1 riboflavin synthase [Chitinophagales bacterium]
MFTGIIESLGSVSGLQKDAGNLHITVQSEISRDLKVDQSVSHNGVCLTVVHQAGDTHTVTAIDETLIRSNLGNLKIGDTVNLERCLKIDGRLDGHIVQGHVDTTAQLIQVDEQGGSWLLTFRFDAQFDKYIVQKGSISINGISLTVFNVSEGTFQVAIIPYTWEHTNLSQISVSDSVNIEFDIIGKYVEKMMAR